jgi:uncharacterized BrkB/YihY/UPF0761 family membrane protein
VGLSRAFTGLEEPFSVQTLKAAVTEFQRDNALGLAAQLAFY